MGSGRGVVPLLKYFFMLLIVYLFLIIMIIIITVAVAVVANLDNITINRCTFASLPAVKQSDQT